MQPAEVVRRAADYLERHDVQSPVPTAERLFAQAFGWLRARGVVAVEIEESTADGVSEAAVGAGFVDPRVVIDLAGRDRVVVARRP